MKTLLSVLTVATLLPATAVAADQLMGGDDRLACEAIVCLANPASQPAECSTALKKFWWCPEKSAG